MICCDKSEHGTIIDELLFNELSNFTTFSIKSNNGLTSNVASIKSKNGLTCNVA